MGVYGNWIRIANQDKYNINYIAERKYGDMKKVMKKLWEKKDSKKGFTLVELIVVLVILAILAAIMIPSLIGWIDKAREKQIVLEARNAYLATQTIVFESHVGNPIKAENKDAELADFTNGAEEFAKLTRLDATNVVGFAYDVDGQITEFTYQNDDFKAIFNSTTNEWTISDAKDTP